MTGTEAEPGVRERLGWLQRNMVSWVLILALLWIAVAVGATYTLGLFSSSSANPANVVAAGSMSQVNSAENAAIMSAPDLVPGQQVEGSVTIRNAGDALGDFRLVVRDVDDAPGPGGGALSDRLVLRVVESGSGSQVYVGPIDGLDVDLGTWEPEEERGYDFVVSFPASSADIDNAYQRSSLTATFQWNAVQSH